MMEGYVSSLEVAFFVPARKMTILLEESLKKKCREGISWQPAHGVRG